MNNEFIKGVIDAKLSSLLTESDYNSFALLSEEEKLTFFINHNLVTTSLVTSFEAMCAYVKSDLYAEISEYLGENHLYLRYFFPNNNLEEDVTTASKLNQIYDKAQGKNDEWFIVYLNLKHSVLNLLTLLRGASLKMSKEEINSYYLKQNNISEEMFASLITSERSAVLSYIKSLFNLDLETSLTNSQIETKLDAYLHEKIKEFAYEPSLLPTVLYYMSMKEYEVRRLRAIYYTKDALYE